jgi:aminoglycoside phosphotransferase (APT) family kinase protein
VLDVQRTIAAVFPRRRAAGHEVLAGGLINTNLKIDFAGDVKPVVLRIYRDGRSACEKEVEIYNLIHREIPVAEIIHAEPDGVDGSPSFAVLEYVEGLTFQQLKRTDNLGAVAQAAASAGETLARIGRFQFPAPGDLVADGELAVGKKFVDGPDPIPRLLDRFLSAPTFQQRASSDLIERLHEFVWSSAALLPDLETERSLVHNDFGNRNILVHEQNGKWEVAAVLDWELAISGSPLLDVAHFLRYEPPDRPLREPHFSRAFVEHGGRLPENWQLVVKLIDLTGLVECLTHDDLPADVQKELFELIAATLNPGTPAR